MRVLLIQPSNRLNNDFAGGGTAARYPLGLACIAAAAREYAEVRIVDAMDGGMPLIEEELRNFLPDLIGISMSWTFTWQETLDVARLGRSICPTSTIILGGRAASGLYSQLLNASPFIDGVVVGEGEQAFADIVRLCGQLRDIPGVACRINGRVVLSPPRPLISDLNSVQDPAYDLVDNFNRRLLLIESSRGCSRGCTYCLLPRFWGRSYRTIRPGLVVERVRRLRDEYGASGFFLADDSFTEDPDHVRAFCDLVTKENLDVRFSAEVRADDLVANPDLIPRMAEAGFFLLNLGIESPYDQCLCRMRRSTTFEQNRKAAEMIKGAGITCVGFILLDAPGIRSEKAAETASLLFDWPLDFLFFTFMVPYPGTELFDQAAADGSIRSFDWEQYHGWRPLIKNQDSEKDWLQAFSQTYQRYYVRREWIMDHLGPVRSFLPISRIQWTGMMSVDKPWSAQPASLVQWREIFLGFDGLWGASLKETFQDLTLSLNIRTELWQGNLILRQGGIQALLELPESKEDVDMDLVLSNDLLVRIFILMELDLPAALILDGASWKGDVCDLLFFLAWVQKIQCLAGLHIDGPAWRRSELALCLSESKLCFPKGRPDFSGDCLIKAPQAGITLRFRRGVIRGLAVIREAEADDAVLCLSSVRNEDIAGLFQHWKRSEEAWAGVIKKIIIQIDKKGDDHERIQRP
ncbi:MAG: radical SAM protein [bacterium]